jgi:transaldolase/glucose-6-phosphate isomerase
MKQGSISITPGRLAPAYERAVRRGVKDQMAPRIMKRDATVFTRKAAVKRLIDNRLGWVDSTSLMKRHVAEVEKFGADVLRDGIKHVVLMGMGGSSLCPDLFRLMCRRPKGLKSFDVIDSTDPSAVKALVRKIDPKKTLFIVASKSGGTVETRSHEAYFAGLLREAGVKNIGRHFVAITDSGSGLQKDARRLKFRKVFVNPSDIGGRYSALSYFGLVPGFFAGVNLKAMVDDALMMQKLLKERGDATNPALVIGALMAAGAEQKCDKLTFVASKKSAPLVPWIEQLVAESTGKGKKGVIPIEAEPLTLAAKYAKDRMFVFLKMAGESTPQADKLHSDLRKRKVAIIEITLGSVNELGRQFLLWEAATAVTGCLMRINPFDEPNVTESKNNTTAILAAFERAGELPFPKAHSHWGRLSLVAHGGVTHRPQKGESLPQLLKRFFKGAKPPKYFSLLNYVQSDKRTEVALEKMRKTVRDRTGMATLRGYGPRYLHSIGQLYKGGPQTGMFVVFVRSDYGHLAIPGKVFGFGQLIAAQSIGDAQALISRNLPTLVFAIDGSTSDGLAYFARALGTALK